MTANRPGHCGLTLTLAALGLSAGAAAQDVGDVFLEEIIVTATKRAGGIDAMRG